VEVLDRTSASNEATTRSTVGGHLTPHLRALAKSAEPLIAQHRANDGLGVLAAMIVIAVVALIAEWLLTMIADRLLTWRPETTVNE
jgi:hypothetical protein